MCEGLIVTHSDENASGDTHVIISTCEKKAFAISMVSYI